MFSCSLDFKIIKIYSKKYIYLIKVAPVQADNDVFMEDVEAMNGELWMPGNRSLISLNLSREFLNKDD